ncbi:MAG: phytanoyl-CoA dioxygenase family protein [Acidobacteriota bacterium]
MSRFNALSSEQVRQFEQEGYLFPVRVLSGVEVARFRAAFEETKRRLLSNRKGALWSQLHLHFRWAYDLVTHPTILDAIEDVLGPNIMVHSSTVFYKPARDASFVSWHQDGTFLVRNSSPALSAWVALSDSTTENGCLRVLPRSHASGRLAHSDTYNENNLLARGDTIKSDVDESQAVDVTLKAGEMSLHHVDTIHGSTRNRSESERIGFTVRYITPRVQTAIRHNRVVLARGQDELHHYDILRRAPADDFEKSLAAHIAAASRANTELMRRRLLRKRHLG